ncbi:MAG: SNF2-related protein [Alicyclobacillaceae bacterium]|nr:SNF2-related protein [Alicyclobacillaceae bacterium]
MDSMHHIELLSNSSTENKGELGLSVPVTWVQQELRQAFTGYIQTAMLCNHDAADLDTSNFSDWRMFQLAAESFQSQLAPDFEELLSLNHVFGFHPLPHQVTAAKKVLQDLRGRAILADEVGLGKTIEAGLVLKEYLLRGLARKILLLVPTSLVLQWSRELNQKFRIAAHPQRHMADWKRDIVVGSIDSAKREPHRSELLSEEWDVVLVDEAHKLKNRKTKNWDLVNRLSKKYVLLLTATPIQNDLDELHALISLLRPGQLGSHQEFAEKHVSSKRKVKNPQELRHTVGKVLIRNRRGESGVYLPKRDVETCYVQLSPEELCLYDSIQAFLRSEYQQRVSRKKSVLPLLTLQREVCSSTYAAMISVEKMMRKASDTSDVEDFAQFMHLASQIRVFTKVERAIELCNQAPGKCIIFTEFRATQDYLLYRLKQCGIPTVLFRGGYKKSKKDWMTDLFEKKAKVLVATESGGEGINLQFCNEMINLDLPWNPMRLEQRIGRIHRIGQTSICKIHNLVTEGTLEEHIVQILMEKIALFESAVGTIDPIFGPEFGQKYERRLLELSLTANSMEELRSALDPNSGCPATQKNRESVYH